MNRKLANRLADALGFGNVTTLLKFGRWTFAGPDWGIYGISLHFEDIVPIDNTPHQITFVIKPPWSSFSRDNTIRYETIVKIMGSDRCTITKDWRGILPGFRWIIKMYQACLKVQKMKVFL